MRVRRKDVGLHSSDQLYLDIDFGDIQMIEFGPPQESHFIHENLHCVKL